ncbi:MAG: ferrous iron transport protein A [Saprospiraceae bacterium]|nr:ferrous iron transport protein A [Saprospiraceae bacterium]
MPTLNQLQVGDEAVIKNFLNEDLGLLLNEMGFLVNDHVKLTGKAPFGDPICLQNEESMISLRKEEAQKIEVEKI